MKFDVSIFILAWNNIDTIKECIESASYDMQVNNISNEIIVVDNGSTDGTAYYGDIRNSNNLGISKGKNQGIDACNGKYIIMLDGDVIPVPNSLNLLYKYIKYHKSVDALGFYPNKWSNQRNNNGQRHYEEYCNNLHEVKPIERACIYYGIFRKRLFDEGLRFDEEGAFGEAGYGWEDHDFYEQMKAKKIIQYVAHINNASGKYYHNINSSIRAMGRVEYMRSSKVRNEYFKNKWGG